MTASSSKFDWPPDEDVTNVPCINSNTCFGACGLRNEVLGDLRQAGMVPKGMWFNICDLDYNLCRCRFASGPLVSSKMNICLGLDGVALLETEEECNRVCETRCGNVNRVFLGCHQNCCRCGWSRINVNKKKWRLSDCARNCHNTQKRMFYFFHTPLDTYAFVDVANRSCSCVQYPTMYQYSPMQYPVRFLGPHTVYKNIRVRDLDVQYLLVYRKCQQKQIKCDISF